MEKLILLTTICFYLAPFCYSQPGQLDPSFGNNGTMINYEPVQYGSFGNISISNGKILLVGRSYYYNKIYRYNLNGTHDGTFGVNGQQSAETAGTITAIQKDGKIVTAGSNFISRYNADGLPDTIFNGYYGYRVIDTVYQSVDIASVAIQDDGKILVAAIIYNGRTHSFGIYRFNGDGSTDKSFSDEGMQKTTFDSIYHIGSLLLQPDGKILVGGDFHIVRYNTDGSLDRTFGVHGKLRISFRVTGMALQSDGKLMVVGIDQINCVMARFNANGSLDNTFSPVGKQSTLFDGYCQNAVVALQKDGKILIAGSIYQRDKLVITLARYKTSGSIDSIFGHNGLQETQGLSDRNTDSIFGPGGSEGLTGLASYSCNDLVILNDRAYLSATRSEKVGFSDYSQGMLLCYQLDESKTTRLQFTEPIYDHASHTAPANINIAADVINPAPGTTIKRVDFYKDDVLMYSDHTNPYSYFMHNVKKGGYLITAKAFDNIGTATTSPVFALEVLPNQPPYIFLFDPFFSDAPHYSYTPERVLYPANFTFTANAYDPDPDGAIRKVEFYDAGKLLYTDSTYPYTFPWNNIPLGKHSITVKATDTTGLTSSIYPYLFSVDTSIEPMVQMVSPFYNQYYAGPLATVNISANAYPMYPGGAISKVEFYNGTKLLDIDSIYPYNFTLTNVPPGSYLISAKATNSRRVSATSATVRIFVVVDQSPAVQITRPGRDTNVITPGPILLTAEASDPYTFIESVAFYNDDSILIFTEYKSPYSRLWESVSPGSYHITAVATDYHGLSTKSEPVHITVLPNTPPLVNITSPVSNRLASADIKNKINNEGGFQVLPTNKPPLVNITPINPAQIITANGYVYLDITAVDTDGYVKSVKIYDGTTFLETLAPQLPNGYEYVYYNSKLPVARTYRFYAKATDNYGATGTSDTFYVTKVFSYPTVAITTPANNTTYAGLSKIFITINATDMQYAGNSISKVELYNGETLLHTDRTFPFTYTWSGAPVGPYSLSAKVTYSTGVEITSSIVNGSVLPDTVLVNLLTPVDDVTYPAHENVYLNAMVSNTDGTISKVEFYNGTTLLHTATVTPYAYTWTNVPEGTDTLIAKATDNNGLATNSAPVYISVISNALPAVNITSPAKGTNFIEPGPIILSADVADANGTIQSVDFYNGNTLIFTVDNIPYQRKWYNVPTGSYIITAVATDNNGLRSASAPVHITVLHNRPPIVSITSPADGATYTAPVSIVLSAGAEAHGGKIKTVEFYDGTTLMHIEENQPYLWDWKNVPAGDHIITAIVTDTYKRTTTSAPITVTVISPAEPLVSSGPLSPDIKTGINDEVSMKLLPNPVRNILNINTTGFQNNKRSISVISTSAVIIKTIQTNAVSSSLRDQGLIQLDVSSIASGMYIIKIITGDKVMYRQFIKM